MASIDELPDQYEVARKRAAQQNNAAVQGQQDAMKRRFAANGSINSGAAIKQQQLVAEAGQQQLQQANEGIDAAQRADLMRLKEAEDARKFSHDERLGTQEWQSDEANLGRKFQTSERLGSQDFSAGQADIGRKFQSSERQAGEAFAGSQNQAQRDLQTKLAADDMAFKKSVQGDENDHFKIQQELANKQFEMDKDTTEFNKMIAQKQAEAGNSGILGSLFGDTFGKGGGKGILSGMSMGGITGGGGGIFGGGGGGDGGVTGLGF